METQGGNFAAWRSGSLSFEVDNTDGELGFSHETSHLGWWKVAEMEAMDNRVSRIHDAVKNRLEVVIQ